MSDAAALIETHISYVFLIGDRAYKLKEPIKTPFLDYSTREARLWACEREVELNRRLSPDVYLGVAPVLDVNGQPCDSLVVMRRGDVIRRHARGPESDGVPTMAPRQRN
jgi:uncharacterized protein